MWKPFNIHIRYTVSKCPFSKNECSFHKPNMEQYFCYKLTPEPTFLSKDSFMWKPDKAALGRFLTKNAIQSEIPPMVTKVGLPRKITTMISEPRKRHQISLWVRWMQFMDFKMLSCPTATIKVSSLHCWKSIFLTMDIRCQWRWHRHCCRSNWSSYRWERGYRHCWRHWCFGIPLRAGLQWQMYSCCWQQQVEQCC